MNLANPIDKKRIILDALNNAFTQPELIVGKYIKQLEDYEIEKALKEAVENKKLQKKLERRQWKHNKNFVWTPEKKEKLRVFNEQLFTRYKEAYNEVCRLKKEFEKKNASGDKNYQDYSIEVEFWYNCDEGLPEKEQTLWEDLCSETIFWGSFV